MTEQYKQRIRELYDQDYTDGQIGEIIGYSDSAVCMARKEMGLPTRHAHNVLRLDYSKIDPEILAQDGRTFTQIARDCHVSHYTISMRAAKLGIDPSPKGDDPMFRLFEQLYDQGMLDREIAAAAGCHVGKVGRWRARTGRKSNSGREYYYRG